jgi:SAM-dependent methyltransferase
MLEKKRTEAEGRKRREDAGGMLEGPPRADGRSDFDGKGWEWYEARYHYNLVENGIIDILRNRFYGKITGKSVLDIGSGSGHWIGFYLHCLQARHVTAIDISPFCVRDLGETWRNMPSVTIQHADFTHPDLDANGTFEVINAIGVMSTLSNEQWDCTLANMIRHLHADGIGIVSGEFGPFERKAGKRRHYRSLEQWKHALKRLGARFVTVARFDWFNNTEDSECKDNLLVFEQK